MGEARSRDLRAIYARRIMHAAGIDDRQVEQAFAAVPREDFLPPPPWTTIASGTVTRTSNLADIYTDVLVAIDKRRGINNGEPALHAAWLGAVHPLPGNHVVHVGAGTGYYTALLGYLTRPDGRVDAYECEADLAADATRNLARHPCIHVHAESAFGRTLPQSDIIYVNAAVSAPDPEWLRALRPGGRLIFPWQPARNWGLTILVMHRPAGFMATPLMKVGFIACSGETTRPMVVPFMPQFDIAQTRSLWLTTERRPDRTATAVYDAVWFSAEELI